MNISILSHTKVNYKMYVLVLAGLLIYILFITYKWRDEHEEFSLHVADENKPPPVYCLMVTGHTHDRVAFARNSVANFLSQSYDDKHMVIINQSDTAITEEDRPNILEIFVNSEGKTLGELRNMSLQLVPPNAIWTTWDDDDWRAPEYISTMVSAMERENADFLMYQTRIEYNHLTKFAFKLTLRSGLMTFFAKQNPYLQYAHVPTSEDKPLKDFAKRHLNTYVLKNDPKLYIRLIHGGNTSVYVDKTKRGLKDTRTNKNFFEDPLSDEEQKFVDNIISKYYTKYV